MKTTETTLGGRLLAAREGAGFTAADVVQHFRDQGVRISRTNLWRWEHDESEPRADQYMSLCQLYGVPVDDHDL